MAEEKLVYPLMFYIWLAVPYMFFCSVLYVYGYWATFNIDIYSYISLAELTKLALYNVVNTALPMVIIFGFGFIISFCVQIIIFNTKAFRNREKEEISGDSQEVEIEKNKTSKIDAVYSIITVVLFIIMMILTVVDYFSTSVVFDYTILIGFAFIISMILGKIIVTSHKDFPGTWYFTIPALIIYVALSSYPNGKVDSNRLLYSPISEHVVLIRKNDEFILPETEIYRYIGFAGDHHFLLESGSLNVHIVKDDSNVRIKKVRIHKT